MFKIDSYKNPNTKLLPSKTIIDTKNLFSINPITPTKPSTTEDIKKPLLSKIVPKKG